MARCRRPRHHFESVELRRHATARYVKHRSEHSPDVHVLAEWKHCADAVANTEAAAKRGAMFHAAARAPRACGHARRVRARSACAAYAKVPCVACRAAVASALPRAVRAFEHAAVCHPVLRSRRRRHRVYGAAEDRPMSDGGEVRYVSNHAHQRRYGATGREYSAHAAGSCCPEVVNSGRWRQGAITSVIAGASERWKGGGRSGEVWKGKGRVKVQCM